MCGIDSARRRVPTEVLNYEYLDTLVDKGLVEKGEKDRRMNVYTTTRRGRQELEDRREWENQYVEEIEAITA